VRTGEEVDMQRSVPVRPMPSPILCDVSKQRSPPPHADTCRRPRRADVWHRRTAILYRVRDHFARRIKNGRTVAAHRWSCAVKATVLRNLATDTIC